MRSVSSRLLGIILSITVAGMSLIAVIGTVIAGTAILDLSHGRLSEATGRNAESINGWIREQIHYTDAIAADFSNREDISPEALLPALISHTDLNEAYYSVYVGYPDGGAVFNDEWVPGDDWISYERDWYRGAAANARQTYVSDLYMDAETLEMVITFSRVFTQNGSAAGVVAIDIFTTVLHDIVSKVDVGEGSYAFMTAANGDILAHHNKEYSPTVDADEETIFQSISEIENGQYKDLTGAAVMGGETITVQGADGVARCYTASVIPSTGWVLYTAIPRGAVNAPIYREVWAAAAVFAVVLACTVLLVYFSLRRLIVRPVKDVTEAANLLARGETGARLDGRYVGEIALLAESFKHMESFNRQQTDWLERIASGDLSFAVTPRGPGDRTGLAIVDMLRHLNNMFASISQSARQVAMGSGQIAEGAHSLAQGTTDQNVTVQGISNAVSDLADKTRGNAQKAGKAAALSSEISVNARQGAEQMGQMMTAVNEIKEASHKVNRVIKAIDDIAFQTNILALNAAVEAARAGQHGKGFAVVAEEVRNLAGKSAEAAKETDGLILNSIEKADLGARIAEETAASLTKIVEGISENTEIIGDIARSSEIQAEEIQQVNNGIIQVAQVIQQNSATAEESAAASREMNSQSEKLNAQVAQFRLSADGDGPRMLGGR